MSQNRNSISKQVLAWTAVFALVLSILPYTVADSNSDEYFESWSYELSDTDGDNQDDTILFTFDVDTNVTDYVDIEVQMEVRNNNGSYVGSEGDDYEIYWTENDTFEMEWFVDDCDDWDDDCNGPFDFHFRLYEDVDGSWYFEDNFTESNISLYETTIIPEGIVQVENGVFANDIDGYHNDIAFLAHMEDYEVSNVTIDLERKVGTQWVDAGDGETDDGGEVVFKNMTSGEYRWFATYDEESIDAQSHTFVFYSPTSDENIGHVGFMDDFDGDDDFDDFAFYRVMGNGSEDFDVDNGVYVELFHAENNTLYAEDGGDGEDEALMFNDVHEGNYTFNMYNGSSDGDLLQTGWMHSYGSLNTNYGEYFESWSNHTEDTNGDGIDNNVFVKYNPDTECNCSVDINVQYNVYDADTGMYVDYDNEDHEINGTEVDNFETDIFYPPRDANYTFEFYLYDTDNDNWMYEDNFTFTVYLECDSENNVTSCDSDEYFESWSSHTNDTNGDGVANNIFVKYNPDTDCNCSVDIRVNYNAFSNETNDQDYDYFEHNITGTEIDNFETDIFYPSGDGNYTFTFNMYDEDYNYEDNFTFTVYLECDTEENNSNCDFNEWFEDWDYVTEDDDDDDDNLDDTIVVNFDPNTECDCEVDIRVYMDVYENSSGNYVGFEYDDFTINGTQVDSFDMDWTSSNSSSYDFNVYMYDDQSNFEDSFRIYDVYLYQTSGAGGPGDEDEYFDWFYHYIYDADEDEHNDTIDFYYDPDTTCDCNINVTTYFDVYDNGTGEWIDSDKYNHTIYNDNDDELYHYWTPWYNGTFDFAIKLYDEDGNLEDEVHYGHVDLHVRSESNGTDDDSEEYFSNWDYHIESSDTMLIEYDPDTDCDCEVQISVYVDILDNNTGDYVDSMMDDHVIYGTESDWFEQGWVASYNGSFDFLVSMYNEDELQDRFKIEDVNLNIGHSSDNQYGIGYVGYIVDFDDDGFTNDFVGLTSESSNETYFEIWHNDSVIDSGESDEMWISNDLPENWYDFMIISSDNQVQEGSFYSYGNSSGNNSSIMNIAQATVEDSEEEGELSLDCEDGPCNDAAFITYIGSPDEENSIPDVTIDIHHFYEENGNWDHYATTYTNESGQAVEYNLVCGEYTWDAHYEGNYINSGYFLVLANCDSEDSNDAYAWFESLSYNLEDRDGDNQEDSININYMVRSSDCDCEMDLLIILDIFDESGNMVDTFEENYTIAANDNMDFSFIWENNFGDGEFTFNSLLEYLVDGDTNGEIIVQEEASETFYLANVNDEPAFNIEDVTGRDNVFEGQNIELGLVLSGTNDVVVDWYMGDGMAYQNVFNVYHTYQQSGNYEIMVHVYDDDNSVEEYFEINVRNMAPTILNIMMDDIVNEGDEVSFNVQYQDVPMDMDNISVMWVFPDGVSLGNFVQYTFADDGEFLVSVEVKDDDGGSSIEQRMITVQNVAPTFTEFILPSQGEQGVAMDFKVSATDPGDDTITYTFDFGDGTAQLITQNGNASHKFASGDTFEIIICVIDEDGGETCRTEVLPVALLEQIEDSGLPGFGFLGVISALGAITLLRRRTH